MVCFPNAKINLGLNIVERRTDGYHNIETLFVPILDLYDVLEIVEADRTTLQIFGNKIDCEMENNLIIKALRLLQKDFQLSEVSCFLKKNIPFGAGLGGGSADAAFMLKMLNKKFELNISDKNLENYAAKLGADCPFFINNKTAFAQGKGDILTDTSIALSGKYIVLVKPDVSVSTVEAYSKIVPQKWDIPLKEALNFPVEEWKNCLFNDFEENVFAIYPQLAQIKQKMYNFGAIYASMSGSGSAIFGIFNQKPNINFEGSDKYLCQM